MDFLHLTFNDFEFRDLGHSDFVSFKVSAPTRCLISSPTLYPLCHCTPFNFVSVNNRVNGHIYPGMRRDYRIFYTPRFCFVARWRLNILIKTNIMIKK